MLKFYVPSMKFSLAGAQMKLSARDTIACEECWAPFQELLNEQYAKTRG